MLGQYIAFENGVRQERKPKLTHSKGISAFLVKGRG